MARNWPRVPIKETYLAFYDGPHATPKPATEGAIFLGIKNISEDGRLDLSDIRWIAEDDFPQWTKRVKPRKNDIVFSYEATLHRYAIIPEGFYGCLGRRLALIRPNTEKVDPKFLFYYFFGDEWRSTVAQKLIFGATVERIPLINFPEFKISLPPLAVQRRIAVILSAYDELIENNTRRIALLEEMAQLIYREWFVHFRFPGHEGVAMMETELGPVPEGWEVKKLGDFSKVKGGKRLPKGKAVQDEITAHAYIRVKDFSDFGLNLSDIKYIDDETHNVVKRYTISSDDVYISIAGTIGRAGIVPKFLSGANLTENAAKICKVTGIDHRLLHCYLHSPEGQAQIAAKVVGTSQPKLALFRIEEIKMVIPPVELQLLIIPLFADCYAQIETLQQKNITLRQTRDLLLPRLVSGELDVSELEIDTMGLEQ